MQMDTRMSSMSASLGKPAVFCATCQQLPLLHTITCRHHSLHVNMQTLRERGAISSQHTFPCPQEPLHAHNPLSLIALHMCLHKRPTIQRGESCKSVDPPSLPPPLLPRTRKHREVPQYAVHFDAHACWQTQTRQREGNQGQPKRGKRKEHIFLPQSNRDTLERC